MVMFFFDEAGELEEYLTFRRQDQPLELKHLEIRTALNQAEEALRTDPENQEIIARIAELRNSLADLERQAPWIVLDYPLEYLLWGPPHG
jgi:hypothetical protein